MPRFTLKTKVTLFFPLIITMALACLLFLIHSLLQSYIKESISKQQYQILSILADDIDQNVIAHHSTLQTIANRVTKEMVDDPQQALAYLRSQNEHLADFDNGMYLFDHKGRIVADTAQGLERTGKDYSFREYLRQTIATQKPFLSDPFESAQQHHHPVITFTAPVFGKGGSLLAIMGGSVDLTRSTFVEKLSRVKLAKGGYVYLYNKDRMLISHPDKSRIMKRDVPLGVNPLFDRAIEGFEGTDETVTSRGLHTLSSFKHLKTKNWIIAANYPVTEAYAPIYTHKAIFIIMLPLLSLFTFWFMRRYLIRFSEPIVQFTHHVENLTCKSGLDRIIPVQGDDEVAILGQAFNTLVRETDLQQERLLADLERHERTDAQLHRQNEYLQALHETTLGLIRRMDVTGLLQAIVTRAGRLVGTEHCFVYLKNSEGNEMEMVFQSGIYNSLAHHPITPGQGIAGRVGETGEPLYVDDYSRWEGRLPDADRDVLRAMAGVPLKAGSKVVGVLGLAFIEPGIGFNDEQRNLLAQFGELASLALENARLIEDSQRELAERKKAEQSLRKLSVAVEQSPASIVITNTAGIIEYVNPHFTLLTGYSPEEVIGKTPGVLKTGNTSSEDYQVLWETILSGGEWRGEFHNRKKDGELYWEQALIAPIRDEKGIISHFIAIKVDISERKKLENQLRHSQKMEAIGQLAGGIAHDFNNILTAIIGYATIMQMRLDMQSPVKTTADQILAAAERGASLTQGLLAFSRKQVSNLNRVNLNEVIQRVEKLLMRLIGEDIHISSILAEQELPLMADSIQLEQLLMNLSTNARDALPNGGNITIRTEAVTIDSHFIQSQGFGEQGTYALLTFSDTGVGMSDESLKRIFEPFYTTKEIGKGTGLGLSIVYGIIKKHDGYVTCKSLPGKGSTFCIYLPLTLEMTGQQAENTDTIPFCGGQEVILLAEDDKTMRMLTKELLEEFGYKIFEAEDGCQALEKYREQRDSIQLVILDAIMPGMKGMDVYRKIHEINPHARVLFCSGYNLDMIKGEDAFDQNLHFIAKPFVPKQLLMKVREVLENVT